MGISQQYRHVVSEVGDVCTRCERTLDDVCVVAVSKTVGLEGVAQAIEGGAHCFGENRPDQILEKAAEFPKEQWHFIGNIQSRRIPDIVASATLIHSLYQMHHAEKINEAAEKLGKIQEVLIEVNVSGESSKSGLAPAETIAFAQKVALLPHVCVKGLMTMAPIGDAQVARQTFRGLAELAQSVKAQLPSDQAALFTELSMGMSDDWPEAIAEGATIVRIGRAIFSDSYQEKPLT